MIAVLSILLFLFLLPALYLLWRAHVLPAGGAHAREHTPRSRAGTPAQAAAVPPAAVKTEAASQDLTGMTTPVSGPSNSQPQAQLPPVESPILGRTKKIYRTNMEFEYYQTTGSAQRTPPPIGHLCPTPKLRDVFVHRVVPEGSANIIVQSWMYSGDGVWATLAHGATHPIDHRLRFFVGRTEDLWPRWITTQTYAKLIADYGDA